MTKQKIFYLSLMIITSIMLVLFTAFSPRFGRRIHSLLDIEFKYITTEKTSNSIVDIYETNDGHKMEIFYTERFSRNIEITYDGQLLYHIYIKMNGQPLGYRNDKALVAYAALQNIIDQDSSGRYYYLYLVPLFMNLYGIYLISRFDEFKNSYFLFKVSIILGLIIIFTFAIAISLRFVNLYSF